MTGRGRGFGGGRRKKGNMEEFQKQRRRDSQARSRAILAGLFAELNTVVCPPASAKTPAKTPAKWKILDHAKGFLKEQEAYLSRLLALKRIYLADEDGPCNMDEVREEYRTFSAQRSLDHSRRQGHKCPGREGEESSVEESAEEEEEEAMDESVQSQSSISPLPWTFGGYPLFYRQTMDTLVRSGVLSQGQMSLAAVSEAISALWDRLSPERQASYQAPPPPPLPQSTQAQTPHPDPDTHPQPLEALSQGDTASSPSFTFPEDPCLAAEIFLRCLAAGDLSQVL